MKTTTIGKAAENAVASHLQNSGYRVLHRNWRNRICEIDLVARKSNIVYFVEVKYRGSQNQGDGFEYITPRKLKQVQLAARVWCSENDWEGDYRLLAVAVSGQNFDIEMLEL